MNSDATLASAYVRLSGMSLREVTEYLGISMDTYRSYQSSRLTWPPARIESLRHLCGLVWIRAEAVATVISEQVSARGLPSVVEIAVPRSEKEVRVDGLPSLSCFHAVVALAATMVPEANVVLVERGSTQSVKGALAARRSDSN